MADVIPMPVPSAVTGPMAPPPGMPPGGQMQIMLPPQLQEVMQKFPEVMTKLAALEARPVSSSPPTKLVAALAFLSGFGFLALLVFLWNYAAVIFRL